MTKLRILLVEDDELFRLGLYMRLQREPGLEVIAEAVDGEMAVELTNQHLPDVVLRAELLHIATGTVRVHVHAILQKLEVRDRTQAAVLAIQKGLVAAELLAK